MKKKIHIVNHTHWDREWYFTTMDALLLSDQLFAHALDELKKNPEAKFTLDGQTSIVTDFLTVNPERKADIKNLVASGQLAIGPWYSQTDAFSIHEESYFRNLAIGISESRKLGGEMRVGYLPDTFGFNAQMPMILNAFGLDNMIFWRGFNLDKFTKTPYFKWKALGEHSVNAANMPGGYGAVVYMNASDDYIQGKLAQELERLEKRTDSAELLLTAGSDQTEIISDLPKIISEINEKLPDHDLIESSYEEFAAFLRAQKLPEYQGELREPVEIGRVHKTIGSVHYDIKRANFLVEQKLLKRVEPLMAIAKSLGIELSNEVLWKAWKKVLEGQAHDSMGGSVMDTVAIDILHRFKEADELADGMENYLAKRLAEKLSLTDKEVIVFNTSAKVFSGYKTIEFLAPSKKIALEGVSEQVLIDEEYFAGKDNILLVTPESRTYVNEAPYYHLSVLAKVELPAMGYKVFRLTETENELESLVLIEAAEAIISNDFYALRFENQKLSLKNQAGQVFHNILEFEDRANDGDTYDFSPLAGDKEILLKLELTSVEKSSLYQKMHLTGEFDLPYDLEDRAKTGKTGVLKLDVVLTLTKGSPRVDCSVSADNQILSHRLRVKINTGIASRESIASLPFGFIRRQAGKPAADWYKSYVEYPIDLEPFDKSVSVSSEAYHVTALAKGLKEYQLQAESLYLTLFASTGQLGKPNLAYRPGRASGDTTNQGHVMMPTPMAQLTGELDFEFA
ncbi:MAG: alpha-mannosidase, partial [Streptococcaceae bacterium]|nr:alpha-mannosidase [Streptococcaceae bacterium]